MSKTVVLQITSQPRRLKDFIAKAQKNRNTSILGNLPAIDAGGVTGGTGSFSPYQGGYGGFGAGALTCLPTERALYQFTQSGSSFINDSGQDVRNVYMDYLLAEPEQYAIDGTIITPVATLLPGTVVSAELFTQIREG